MIFEIFQVWAKFTSNKIGETNSEGLKQMCKLLEIDGLKDY